MSPHRSRNLRIGGALAVTSGVLADQGSLLGADLPHAALLGLAVGAVVGLVPDRTVAGRLSGFLAGFLAAWVGYALRAGFLPDIPMGRAIAAVAVVGVVTAVATISSGRIPLWAGLLGSGALIGSYETTFAATPTTFVGDSMTAATTVLLAAALGLLVSSALSALPAPVPAGQPEPEPEDVPLDALLLPAPRAAADASADQELSR